MINVVIVVKIRPLGFLPVIVDGAGEINTEVLAWSVARRREHSAPKTLYGNAVSLSLFAAYWKLQEGRSEATDIFSSFFEALVHGFPEFGWEGVSTDTAMRHIKVVNQFVDWCTDALGVENPNPEVAVRLSWGARLKEYKRRSKTDIMAHLAPATNGGGASFQKRKIEPYRRAERSSNPDATLPKKRFTFDDFNKLVSHEENPRYRGWWLLLGGGGVRISEAMQLYVEDILFDRQANEARIRLSDPVYGYIDALGADGKVRRYTRQEYLKEKFGRGPLEQLAVNDPHWAGWKGMQLHDVKEKTAEIFWLHPYFGEYMWRTHLEYLALRGETHPQHPYYFVNFKHNRGEPMAIGNIRAILKGRCRRLNIQSADHPHALRHMYVDYLCNVLGIPLHEAQLLVRHRSCESTEIYARAAIEAKKRALSYFMNKLPQPSAQQYLNRKSEPSQ